MSSAWERCLIVLSAISALALGVRRSNASRADLADEAAALIRFLADRDPEVDNQYGHWWQKRMPKADVGVLPG